MAKSRREEWDPKQVKVLLKVLRKIDEKNKKERAAPGKDGLASKRAAELKKRLEKVTGKEAVTLEAPPPPAMGVKAGSGLVAKDEKLEKQMTSQMSRVRYRR